MGFILLFFSAWRIIDLIIAYIAKIFDTYNESFPYRFQLYHQNPFIPKFLIQFANYDGSHYLHIAHNGYTLFEQAFFPLFPLIIHLLAPLFGEQYFLTGIIITNICFLLGLYFFKKYLENVGKNQNTIVWTILFLLTFPTSFFFGAVYTEGLFFLLVTGSLYFAWKKNYWLTALFSFLAALTRLMGIFLIIPIFATIVLEQREKKLFPVVLSPLLGLCGYAFYLYKTVHNPMYFYYALEGFHTGRSIHHIILLPQIYYRYISIFLKASPTFIYFVALLEFVVFNLFFCILIYDLWILWKNKNISARISFIGLNIFSFVNLILPTFTGTLTSLPRYSLLSLSFFLRIAEINNLIIRITFLIIFALFHILLLSLFIQGYFIS